MKSERTAPETVLGCHVVCQRKAYFLEVPPFGSIISRESDIRRWCQDSACEINIAFPCAVQ
jgi:hypothetical protein